MPNNKKDEYWYAVDKFCNNRMGEKKYRKNKLSIISNFQLLWQENIDKLSPEKFSEVLIDMLEKKNG